MDYLLEGLNSKQQEAVCQCDGMIRVVAGAGSGKTRVLAHRYAFLVNEVGIDPANILCMTFTNKAAQEMKSRIKNLVALGNTNDLICTIHGFCVKVLRRDIFRIGYPKTFSIIDEEDCKALAKQVLEANGIDRKKDTVRDFLVRVAHFKSLTPPYIRFLLPDAKVELKQGNENNTIIQYIQLQRQYYSLDFEDIMHFALYILNEFEEARDYWQTQLNYIQIDEVQDCNLTDWNLINLISAKNKNLFIVGDPDQAIYEWRGARPDAFINFPAEKDIILAQNYRSTPNILNVANSVIAHNINRIPKDLITQNASGDKAIHYHGRNEADEARWIVKQIRSLQNAGNFYSDFAILYRATYLSRSIEKELIAKQVPYTIWGGVRFFERKEIKDALCYLRLAAGDDDLAFRRVINTPSRKFGKVSLKKLEETAKCEKLPLYIALKRHINEAPFNKPELTKFVTLIDTSREMALKGELISDIMEYLLSRSGLTDELRNDEDEERLENIKELMHDIRNYESDNFEESINLNQYLQDIALYTNADMRNNQHTVKLMTTHQAKGLEFPFVFVCGLSEGIFPSYRSLRERKLAALEEERRLMYVAITRAEKALFLTESEGYNISSGTSKFPSRFLSEIQKNLITVKGNIDPYLIMCSKKMAREIDATFDDAPETSNSTFKPGDTVRHKVFGVGTVIGLTSSDPATQSVTVNFSNTIRTLKPSFLTKE